MTTVYEVKYTGWYAGGTTFCGHKFLPDEWTPITDPTLVRQLSKPNQKHFEVREKKKPGRPKGSKKKKAVAETAPEVTEPEAPENGD